MALVKCRECAKEISGGAVTCPQCGAKQPKRTKLSTWIIGGVALIGVAMCTTQLSEDRAPAKPKSAAETAANEKASEGMRRAQLLIAALKKGSRNPEKFSLDSVLIVDATNAVCVEFRAENGFGGMSFVKALMTRDGKTIRTSDENGFPMSWNRECANQPGRDYTGAFRLLN